MSVPNFCADASWVNGTTPYYDLTAPLRGMSLRTVGFSPSSLQYGRETVFLPNNTLVPISGYSLESTKYAGDSSYFNTYGGGTPPAFPPSTPDTTGAITTTSITTYFSSQGVSGSPPATYSFLYGTTQNPTTPFPATLGFGTLYVGKFTGLIPSTTYYFVAVASNPEGTQTSPVSVGIMTATPVPSPLPPSGPPTVPTLVSATATTITVQFDAAGVTGNPTPTFYARLGSTPLTTTLVSGTLYQATATGLTPTTAYNFFSVATNSSGSASSTVAPFSTTGGTPVAPSQAPSVPTLVSTTSTSITVQFNAAGVSGFPIPTFYATGNGAQLTTTLVSGTTYQATATGLLPATSYPFTSSATNSQGTKTSGSASFQTGSAPSPTSLQSLYVVDFLLFDGVQWVIDQQNIPDIGQWFLTGGQAGQIQANTGQSVIPYLKSLQATGCKIIVSLGGGGLSAPILATMFGNPQNTAASICYALLTKGIGTNPLGFAKASSPWADFAFDGLDMDVETNTPQPSDQYAVLQAIHTLVPSAILTSAPQAPNITTPNAFGGNGNGSWYPFPHVYSGDTLALYNTASSTSAWMYPPLLSSCGMNYMFVQFYNQGPSWYPGTPGTSFIPALAMWGFLCVKSQAVLGTGCKVIIGFATTDGQPLWNQATDSVAVNSAITSANSLITAEAGFSSVVPSMWLAGWGAWNSPSANSVVAGIYSPAGGIPNLPSGAVQLYSNNAGSPSKNPEWTGPVPNTRG